MKSNITYPLDSQDRTKEKYPGQFALEAAIRKANEERERNSRKRAGCETLYWIIEKHDHRISSLLKLQVSNIYVEYDRLFIEDKSWDEIDHWVTDTYCVHRDNFNADQWEIFTAAHIRYRQKEAESERDARKLERTREARKAQQTARPRRGRRASGR